MLITYYGHSCFSVKTGDKILLFDPFIKDNPLAKQIDISKIKADYIFISHGHEDHIADAISIAKRTEATVVSNFEIITWLEKKGIANVHPMNIGGHWIFDFGKVKCVNAVHSSSLPDGSYGGNPMGFLIETPEGNFYYSGDTALTYDMKLIGDYKSINFALMPVGGNFTMGIDNAILASDFINCEKIIGLHYDTYPIIKINHKEAVEKFMNAGKELMLLPIGNTIEI
jgi:L-ascorbate metabolism protein UlaG (beta-lactamase superfamily)